MKSREFISELGGKPSSWNYSTNSIDYVVADFQIDNLIYTFIANDPDSDSTWDIEFRTDYSDKDAKIDSYGITNTGNQYAVLVTISDIINKFVHQHNPEVMIWQAEEPNRKKLYLRIIAQLFPNWRVELRDPHIWLYNPSY